MAVIRCGTIQETMVGNHEEVESVCVVDLASLEPVCIYCRARHP